MEDVAENKNTPISLKDILKWSKATHGVRISQQFSNLHINGKNLHVNFWTICDGDLLSRLMPSTVCVSVRCPSSFSLDIPGAVSHSAESTGGRNNSI